MKKNRFDQNKFSKLKRGDGEMIGGAVVMLVICFLCIYLSSFAVRSGATNALSKAATCAARAAAVCGTMDEAKEKAYEGALLSVTNSNISDINVDLELVGGTSKWETGGYLGVTVGGYVHTLGPLTSGEHKYSVIVCIEQEDYAT